MARENLPGIITNLTDNNLTTTRPIDLGDKILIIGTASQGPDFEPTVVRNVQDAIDTFGPVTSGNLVRGYVEAFYAPGGRKDITCMRIGNGEKAALELNETLGSDEDEETRSSGDLITALTLTALYPGQIYNNVSIVQEYVNGQNSVRVYNPITEEYTNIPYDSTGSVTGSVSDVKELADAINADSNVGAVISAEANEIRAVYEVDVHRNWDYCDISSATAQINLITLLDNFDYDDDGIVEYPTSSGNASVDYTDLLLRTSITAASSTINVYSDEGSLSTIATDWPTTGYIKICKVAGDGTESEVEIIRYNGTGPSYASPNGVISVDTAVGITGYSDGALTRGFAGTVAQAHDADDHVEFYIPVFPLPISVTAADDISQIMECYEHDEVVEELDAAASTTATLSYPVKMGTTLAEPLLKLDETPDLTTNGEARFVVRNSSIGEGDGSTLTYQFTAYETIDETATDDDGDTILKIYLTSTSGTTVEIDSSTYTFNLLGGSGNSYVAEVVFATPPANGAALTIDYNSEIFTLTQLATLYAAQQSTSYAEYFAAGMTVTFGAALPYDIKLCYMAKKNYTPDREVIVSGTKDNIINISAPSGEALNVTPSGVTPSGNLPDGTSGDLGTIIGLDYYYLPEWVDITGAQSLQGGTNGIDMTNSEKYTVLANAYEVLVDIDADIVVPMETAIDDTKTAYDPNTGQAVTVNAGFAAQLGTFLEGLMDGTGEAYGILTVGEADSAKVADVTSWYNSLHTVSTSDPTRAANIMATIDDKHLDVQAIEVLTSNPVITAPYYTTAEAIVAGIVAKLPAASAPTGKFMGNNVLGLRYRLSPARLDALTGDRYVTARIKSGVGVVITDGVTAAATTSDWTRRSTFRIIAEAMEAIREVAEPFIGEGFNAVKKAAMDTAISKTLTKLKEAGSIQSFSYSITQTSAQAASNEADVYLIIQPAFELRRISVTRSEGEYRNSSLFIVMSS